MSWLWPVLLSMSPFVELRAGIPAALALGYSPFVAFVLCVSANMLVAPAVFVFLEFVHYRFLHVDGYRANFDRVMERVRSKSERYVERYGVLGLTLLTAVPLPGTGAYSATLVGWFFGLGRFRTIVAVSLGVFIAGVLVSVLSAGGLALTNMFL
ncbi:ligand-binding protein SH3 [Candidatus Woesearchaeota archaeon]|nr:MAG: ligand-binding protein SH3 [Candidatus Woesearchaeota archaeon]